jgi:hypothetical protein
MRCLNMWEWIRIQADHRSWNDFEENAKIPLKKLLEEIWALRMLPVMTEKQMNKMKL